MSLYLRVRAASFVLVACLATVGGVLVPVAWLPITTGPMGATVAIGLVLALVVPITAAWACGRGTVDLERVAVQNIRGLDVTLVLMAVAATSACAAAAELAHASTIGLLVARAMLTFTGLLLAAWWRGGWETAAVPPTLYFLAVAVFGRGEDTGHPAFWAWIAADGHDGPAWIVGGGVFAIGLALSLVHIRRSV